MAGDNQAPGGRAAHTARDVNFPTALRGYDRDAVDRYVEEVNQAIAELEISSSPQSAIRHALEQVSEETSGLLQRAHETADEITERSRSQADDRLQRAINEADEVRAVAAREAAEMRAKAEAQVEALRRNADAIAAEREVLIEELREAGRRLAELADEEEARFAEREQPATSEDEPPISEDEPTEKLEAQPEPD